MKAISKFTAGLARRLEWLLALALASLIIQIMWEPFTAWAERPRPGSLGLIQLPASSDEPPRVPQAIETACMIYLPVEYSRERRVWPLILYLHGSRAADQTLEMVRAGGLPAVLDRGRDPPAIVAAPVCRPGESWRSRDLIWLLDRLAARYPIDRDAVYLTGYSMGGYGSWEIAAFAPAQFAAIVPLSGGGSEAWASKLTRLPVWAFHGENDEVIPMSAGKEMIDAVAAAGGSCRFTVIPNAGHDICSQVYEKEELYDWLFSHRRR